MEIKNEKTLGERVRELRKKNGLTQLQLAEKLKITDKAVSKWEAGEGNPDISLLTIIASIFNCTIDYLLTGKEPVEKVVFMSKLELCAKNDDPTILEPLDNSTACKKDENGVSLLSYVKKYNSFKVFKKMLGEGKSFNFLRGYIDGQVFIRLIKCDKEREALLSFNCSNEIRLFNDFANPLFNENRKSEQNKNFISSDYDMIFRYLVENYDKLTKEQKDYYFNLDGSEPLKKTNCWFDAYPYLIDYAYRLNKAFYKQLMERIPDPDELEKKRKEIEKSNYGSAEFIILKNQFINLLRCTFDYAIKNHEIDEAKNINRYLVCPLDEYEISRELILKDSSLSEEEKNLQLCKRNGLIIVDILLQIDDLKKVKKVLEEGYVTYNELFNNLLEKRQYRDLYRFCVDNNMNYEADCLMAGKYEEFESKVKRSLPIQFKKVEKLNISPLYEAYTKEAESRNAYRGGPIPNDCSFAYGNEKIIKSYIASALQAKQDHKKLVEQYNKATKEINEEYIFDLVKKGESNFAVIKLCLKLEAVFVEKYNYEGDLFSMMKQYCDQYGFTEDYDGYKTDTRASQLLQKLRMYRNSIAHPTEKGEKLSYDEFKECIKIVFSL